MTTRNQPFVEVDELARSGQYEEAATMLTGEDRDVYYNDRDKVLYYLDVGMLYHYAGEYDESTEHLNEAERLIEEYFTKSISQAAATLLINDTKQDYAGEDYEDIYLNVFKALNFLEQDEFDPAFVEVRRIDNKLNLLEDKYRGVAAGYNQAEDTPMEFEPGETNFHNSALARYLSMVMYRAEGDYDGARIDKEKIDQAFQTQPGIYNFDKPDLSRALDPSVGPRLIVMAFTGESPEKRASTLRIITENDLIIIQGERENEEGILETNRLNVFPFPGVEGGFRFKFQMPRMELRGSDVARIEVLVDGSPIGTLERIESIQKVAQETFEVRKPLIYFKTITRVVIKGVLAERGKEKLQEAAAGAGTLGLLGSIAAGIATDVAVDVSEKADLRISRYFPAFAYVGEFEVPEGEHSITVRYFDGLGNQLAEDSFGPQVIDESGVNLITSYAPR
jgi:tetratricopeptide (TPR) repeat protein